MKKTQQQIRRRFLSGFTLVELMVAIAIIAVLVAIAAPAFRAYALKSRFSEVVVSTAPARAAVAACATSGDCLFNNSIFVSPTIIDTRGFPGTLDNVVISDDPTQMAAARNAALMISTYLCQYYGGWCLSGGASADLAGENGSVRQAIGLATLTEFSYNDSTNIVSYIENNVSSNGPLPVVAMTQLESMWEAFVAAGRNGPFAGITMPCVGTGANCSPPTKYVQSMSVSSSGVITAVATSTAGLGNETFTLTPNYVSGRVDWVASGTCKTRDTGAIC